MCGWRAGKHLEGRVLRKSVWGSASVSFSLSCNPSLLSELLGLPLGNE